MSNTSALPTVIDLETLHREHRELAARVARLEGQMRDAPGEDAVTLCVFSNELDRLLAAFSIANSSAACGMRVTMFFTFWGVTVLKREGAEAPGKTLVERVFGRMLAGGPVARRLSKLELGGIGRWMIRREMRRKGIADLAEQIGMAKETGVEFLACGMSMDLMGIRHTELMDYPNLRMCGATQFIDVAARGNVTLFI
jgi:peroxiredoxin family protein